MLTRRNESDTVLRTLDWPTVIIYLIMVLAGVISIYAASYDYDDAAILSFDEFSGKQALWIGLGLCIAGVIMLIEVRMFETYAYPIYVLTLLLLLVTPFLAPDIKGSRSWLVLGPMSLQPAEFAKFATALALAKLFSGYNFLLNAKMSNYVRAITIIILPVILILAQKETGSALTFMALFFVLYREGMSGIILFAAAMAVIIFVVAVKFTEDTILGITTGQFWIFVLVAIALAIMMFIYCRRWEVARNVLLWLSGYGIVLWLLASFTDIQMPGLTLMLIMLAVPCIYLTIMSIRGGVRSRKLLIPVAAVITSICFMFSVHAAFNQLQPHQQLRIKVVLGIEEDLRGAGYNVNQSKIAIGSGGFAGKGFLEGTQTKLKYVPEQHTDFIFCTIGEEEGFWGTMLVMALFVALILRILAIAERQPTTFGRVYGYCVASYLIFHFCINIGMVIGLCPVIGIPLPFFSYGGSSLWGFTILLFILLRIDAGRREVLSY